MSVKIVLSDPWSRAVEDLDLSPTLELGPFERVSYEDGWWFGDGERVAEVFTETINDMSSSIFGHPLAGYTIVPRTFGIDEQDDPNYPGKPYEKVEIMAVAA